MSREESKHYALDKRKGAGCIKDVFSPDALKAISNYSEGAPRMVNRICNTSLNAQVLLMALKSLQLKQLEDLILA